MSIKKFLQDLRDTYQLTFKHVAKEQLSDAEKLVEALRAIANALNGIGFVLFLWMLGSAIASISSIN